MIIKTVTTRYYSFDEQTLLLGPDKGGCTGTIAPGLPLQGVPRDDIYLFQIKYSFGVEAGNFMGLRIISPNFCSKKNRENELQKKHCTTSLATRHFNHHLLPTLSLLK